MIIKNKFDIGEIVYLKTDQEQKARIVIGIQIRPTGILYILQLCTNETYHYDIEIQKDLDILKTLNINNVKD